MLTTKLKNIADAIREKTGKTDTMKLEDMPDEILGIPSQSGYSIDDILDGNISSVESDWSGSLPIYKFYQYKMSYVNLPNVTSVGNYAFSSCDNLISASLPSVTSVGDYAFDLCSSLTSVSLPSATSVADYAFSSCSSLTSASLPNATSVGLYAFRSCSSLISASLPSATSVGNYAFSSCSNLISASLPSVSANTTNTFSSCSNLQKVDFRRLTGTTNTGITGTLSSCFNGCKKLEYLAFQNLTRGFRQTSATYSPFASALVGTTILTQDLHVIFDMERVVSLGAAAGFAGSTANNSKIHIYVPTSQLSGYSSSKWNSFTIHTIEESEDVLKGKYDWIDEKYFQN